MTHFAQDERQALCDLFLEIGPSAPTLCSGWTTADLAAHLVIRERRPDAAFGIVVPFLAEHTQRVQDGMRDSRSFQALVGLVRSGPPGLLRPTDELMNVVEYYVHHEDVLRAQPQWEPRPLQPELESFLWGRLRTMRRLLGRKAPVGVTMEAAGFGSIRLKAGEPSVTVRGKPGELVLVAFGRGDHAKVSYVGDDVSVERFRKARLGL